MERGFGKNRYVSRGAVNSFSLISDQSFIVQNAQRIARAFFEIVLRKNMPLMSGRVLRVCKMIESRVWPTQHPLRQMATLGQDVLHKLEDRKLSLDRLHEMDSKVRSVSRLLEFLHFSLTAPELTGFLWVPLRCGRLSWSVNRFILPCQL